MEAYEAPEIIEVGSVGKMTEAESTGSHTDQLFPDGTPFDDLTFS